MTFENFVLKKRKVDEWHNVKQEPKLLYSPREAIGVTNKRYSPNIARVVAIFSKLNEFLGCLMA